MSIMSASEEYQRYLARTPQYVRPLAVPKVKTTTDRVADVISVAAIGTAGLALVTVWLTIMLAGAWMSPLFACFIFSAFKDAP